MAENFDVIVIGAGIEGSSIAYTLRKNGQRVLLLEQFPLPHGRGSSAGHSRITRYAYEEDFYVRMMVDAFPLWSTLAEEAGVDFFVPCGTIDIRKTGAEDEKGVIKSLTKHQIPHEVLNASELNQRFPMIKSGGDEFGAIWDPQGGLLKADKCLAAFQTVFKRLGGVLRDAETVTSMVPGDIVHVVTSKGLYKAPKVVVATGPWTGPIATSLDLNLPLKPIKISVLYWKTKENMIMHDTSRLPCVLDSRDGQSGNFHVYALPIDEYPGLVKMCLHTGPEINPDHRDDTDSTWVEERVTKFVAELLPFVDASKPVIRESCIYTVTPDAHPFIDRHPKYKNLVICAGFSGHGFKLAPAVGKAVSEMILDKKSDYNMTPFRIDRFSPKANL